MSSGVLALSLLWAGVLTPSRAQNVPYGAPIKIELAKKAAQAAAAEMRKRNLEMTIAVVDCGAASRVPLERAKGLLGRRLVVLHH